MGAGSGPVEHPPRPPIPIAAVDADGAAATRERLRVAGLDHLAELAGWLAAVAGARPLSARLVVTARDATARGLARAAGADVVVADPGIAPRGAEMSVGEVAHAVDAGRDLAARAAADGVTVLAAAAQDGEATIRLADDALDAGTGPLRTLRRHGSPALAVLCGVALGAGERGLGLVAAGPAAQAAARVAAGVEPDLHARLLVPGDAALTDRRTPVEAATATLTLLRLAEAARRA